MTYFRNKSYFNLGNSFKVLHTLITVRRRCSGRETHSGVPAGVGTCARGPYTLGGGKWARGDQRPPRQWDEFMMDTGTAGDSWHDMFVHTVECHGQGRKEGRTSKWEYRKGYQTVFSTEYRTWWGCSHSSGPGPGWKDIKYRRILRRRRPM